MKKSRRSLYFFWGIYLFAENVMAVSPAERDIDLFLRQSVQEKSEQAIKDEKEYQSLRERTQNDISGNAVGAGENGIKFIVKEIIITNDELFKESAERKTILSRHQNTLMGKYEVLQLIRELTNFYVGKGYSSSMVSLEKSNLRQGVLTLNVLWGKINDFQQDKKSELNWRQKLRLYTAIPAREGGVLNMLDLDQGLENLLKVSPAASVKVSASDKMGYSNVSYNDLAVNYTSFNAGINNSGSYDRGTYQYYMGLSARNVFGLNDTLSGRYAWYDLKDNKERQYTAFGLWNIPVGYWQLDFSYLYSNYEQLVGGVYGRYVSEGMSERTSAKLSRTISRNARGKFSSWVRIEKRRSANYIEQTKIDVSTKNYSNISTGVNYVGTALNGWLYADASITAGRPWFNVAWKNDPDLVGYDVNFVKYNGYLNWKKNIAAYKRIGLQYESNMSFQYSNGKLVSSEQYILGDEYTVRGFKNNSISGSSGALLSNNLNFPFYMGLGVVDTMTPFIGYDIGVSHDTLVSHNHNQYLSGASVGVKISNKYMSGSVTSSWPIRTPQSLRSRKIDNQVMYLNFDIHF